MPKEKSRRSTLTGDWTELKEIQIATNDIMDCKRNCSSRQRPHVRKIFERGGSLEQLNKDAFFNTLLLQTCPPGKEEVSLTHSPSDPGICMDSGSGDDTKTNGQHSSSSSGIAEGDDSKTTRRHSSRGVYLSEIRYFCPPPFQNDIFFPRYSENFPLFAHFSTSSPSYLRFFFSHIFSPTN